VAALSENPRRHIGVGSISLHVNRNANIWSEMTMFLSRTIQNIKKNYDDSAPIEIIVVYVVPGFKNPVEFSGTRMTLKSRKAPGRVQVEAAIPNLPFPEDNPEKAKKIVLDLMLDAVKEVEVYANKNKTIKGELVGPRSVIRELREKWDVSDFRYEIPDGLPYFDLPKVDEITTRRFVEKLPNGGVRHYNVLLDQHGKEIS
jgi:hypothetical protein